MNKSIFDLEYGVAETLGIGQQIVIFKDEEGIVGWRGVGQILPERSSFMCAAEIYFEDDGENLIPAGIGFYSHADMLWFGRVISGEHSFESGYIIGVSDGIGHPLVAQYAK